MKIKKSEESEQTRQSHAVAEPDAAVIAMDETMPIPAGVVTHDDSRQAMGVVHEDVPHNTIAGDKFYEAVEALDGKIETVHSELDGEMKIMRREFKGEIKTVRAELGGEIKAA